MQTSELLKSFEEEQRSKILQNANIPQAELSGEIMVAMKADMGVQWEN